VLLSSWFEGASGVNYALILQRSLVMACLVLSKTPTGRPWNELALSGYQCLHLPLQSRPPTNVLPQNPALALAINFRVLLLQCF
jgi:hypothetical protein